MRWVRLWRVMISEKDARRGEVITHCVQVRHSCDHPKQERQPWVEPSVVIRHRHYHLRLLRQAHSLLHLALHQA